MAAKRPLEQQTQRSCSSRRFRHGSQAPTSDYHINCDPLVSKSHDSLVARAAPARSRAVNLNGQVMGPARPGCQSACIRKPADFVHRATRRG